MKSGNFSTKLLSYINWVKQLAFSHFLFRKAKMQLGVAF